MKQYTLTLDPAQVRLVADALDLYARIGMGQLDVVIDHHRQRADCEELDHAQDLINQAKLIAVKLPGQASFGINSPEIDDQYRHAFDIRCVIRHHLAKENPSSVGVDSFPPRRTGKLSLPIIETKE